MSTVSEDKDEIEIIFFSLKNICNNKGRVFSKN